LELVSRELELPLDDRSLDDRSLLDDDERSLLEEPLPERFEPSAWPLDEPLRDPLWLLDGEPLILSWSLWRSPICPSS
jgi:hypothetical protein